MVKKKNKRIEGEEIERKILMLLRRNKKKKFNTREISREIGHGYPASLKYTDILFAKGLINIEDYGNVKLISYKEVEKDGVKKSD